MIVLDASAMIEALIGRDVAEELLDALVEGVSAPHLLDVEVLSGLRGLLLGGKLDASASIRRCGRAGLMANAPVTRKNRAYQGPVLHVGRSTRSESLPHHSTGV